MPALISFKVLRRSLQTSAVVGAVLVVINHFNIFRGEKITFQVLIQILLCFFVPLTVSLYSQISMMRSYHEQRQPEPGRQKR